MIANAFDLFLFDLDGVLYIGDEACPYASETIERLRTAGKHVRFVTNNPCTTRQMTADKLNRLGIQASFEEVITAGSATAHYLLDQGIYHVYVLGDEFLKKECMQLGLNMVVIEEAEAIIVGWDDAVTFEQVREAAKAIRKGARLVATGNDLVFPMPDGPAPAAGTMIAALEAASGEQATVIGKPFSAMFQAAMNGFNERVRAVMIGDNRETDIKGAHQFGIPAVLVSHEHSEALKNNHLRKAEAEISHLKQLFDENISMKNVNHHLGNLAGHVKVAVAAMIQDEYGRILLINRKDSGEWGILSGHVELGETVEEAVIREVQEETNLNIKVERLIGIYSDPETQSFTYPNGDVSQFVTIYFACRVIDGELKRKTNETIDAQYFEIKALPKKLMKMHPTWLSDALDKTVYIR